MIPVLVVAHFGWRATQRLAFPLAFLFFSVPFGDFLQPTLMVITADFAEQALRWSGLTVAREGLFLILPNSRWQILESCSGLRFTVAGAVLATLFAFLTYRSIWKRALFVVSAIAVSIFANGVRAYVLILIGHLTEMRRGQGFDHYFYGWLVFTIIMSGWFLLGAHFRDRETRGAPGEREQPEPDASRAAPSGPRLVVTGLALLAVVAWPAFDRFAASRGREPEIATVAAPSPSGVWKVEDAAHGMWRPIFHGATSESNRAYGGPEGSVQCHIAYYANQSQGRELLRERNSIVHEEHSEWRTVREVDRQVPDGGSGFTLRETVLRSRDAQMVVWHWYWIPDEYTTNPIRAKFLQARARLLGRPDHAAMIVLTASSREPRDAERLLATFCGEMLPAIRRSLRSVYDAR